MNIFDNQTITPEPKKPRIAKQRPTYYKTECLNCDLILAVKWELAYFGTLPTHSGTKPNICVYCGSTNIKTLNINEKEYIDINQKWDMVDSVETDDEESLEN